MLKLQIDFDTSKKSFSFFKEGHSDLKIALISKKTYKPSKLSILNLDGLVQSEYFVGVHTNLT